MRDDPRFVLAGQLAPSAKRYVSLDKKQQFSCRAFPLERESLCEGKQPPQIEHVLPETFVLELENAKVSGNNGYIIVTLPDGEKKFLLDTVWDWEDVDNFAFQENFNREQTVKKIQGRVAVIAQSGSYNYYHWVTEVLPRIELLKRADAEYDYLYVPILNYAFQKDSLLALGIDISRIIEGNDSTVIEADLLVIPSSPSYSTISPSWAIDFIKKSLLGKECQKTDYSRRIFISRKNALYRFLPNENELLDFLTGVFNVRPVYPEDWSIEEQACIFSQAEVIIALHGAELTNLIFARPETVVIEIFQYHLDETFWILSQQLGLRHYCLLGLHQKSIEKLKDYVFADTEGRYANEAVDLEKIRTELSRLPIIM